MDFYQLLQSTVENTTGPSLRAFLPELILCGTIVALLLFRMTFAAYRGGAVLLMLAGAGAALYFAAPWHYLAPDATLKPVEIFTGMLVYDKFSIYMRGLLLAFAMLFSLFTYISGIPDRDEATEFYTLILGATLGMCLMVSANHMMIVFLGVEMASVPSYVLAGLLRYRRTSSEAALKFAVFGGATAGIMLYGISLLVGMLGTAHLPTMADQLGQVTMQLTASIRSGQGGAEQVMVLVLGALMVMVGLAFKLSAVPFHFWTPDVFEGASAEVGAFLSVASKAAALGLLVRLAVTFGATPWLSDGPSPPQIFLGGLLVLLSAVTCTFGNLAAYGQTNMKRLLAYSTIAHAGYMMMPVAAAVFMAGSKQAEATEAIASLGFYIAVYLLMNLAAFAAVAFLRNRLGSEQIDDYAGLIQRSPGFVVCFSLILFSLIGLPPLAGFAAKFTIFKSLADAGLVLLLAIGVLNTALSLFYYLRVVRVMVMAPEPAGRTALMPLGSPSGLYYLALTAPVVVLGLWWNGLFQWAQSAATPLLVTLGMP